MKRITMLVLLVHACCQWANAQTDQRKKVMAAFQTLAATYQKAGLLSFDITYRYAAEQSPAVYLDSLRGHFTWSNTRYWCLMENTESVYTGDYMIMLFKDDQLMYLARPTQNMNPAAGGNPLQLMDSFLVKNPAARCSLDETIEKQVIRIDLDSASSCKRIEYHIDKRSGYVTRVISVVNSEQLYDPSVRSLLTGKKSYAIVEALYSNYRKATVDDALFTNSRYFKKEEDRYVAVAPYEGYKVFLGTPGM